ncbi:MAG: hexose kinase [Candidatus Lokiarchaeota archaeon]|nr:hexose kinase [Candidatus Lokiarchaeota archaeon]
MKIYAILLNPTIDQIYEINNFNVGGTFKVSKNIIYPVGKTISFSLAIRELDKRINLKVIAFIGNKDLQLYSDFLVSKNIDYEFIKINGKTRSNKTINDPINKTTTHIREKGFELNKKKIIEFKKILNKNIEKNNIYVFSGSIPQNTQITIYKDLIRLCREKGGICVLDTNGTPLIHGLKSSPQIIKPNLIELSFILDDSSLLDLDFSNPIPPCMKIIQKAKHLLNNEIEIILITLGKYGGIVFTKDIAKYGNIELENVIDTVGSGDSFLAGFVLYYCKKKNIHETFKYALATGAANTQKSGPGMMDFEKVKDLVNKVKIIDIF